jgi:hypothetical protein
VYPESSKGKLTMGNVIRIVSVLLRWSKGVRRSRTMILSAAISDAIAGLGSTALIAVINAFLARRSIQTPASMGIHSSQHNYSCGGFRLRKVR